ncbi:MAG: hypothetical protein AB1540_15640 [Bdellovibrionota bacterium]
MLYFLLFLIRYFPFWAIPVALVIFEIGVYYYNRRQRFAFVLFFGAAATLTLTSIAWLVFEGYWRAGPIVKKFFDSFTTDL